MARRRVGQSKSNDVRNERIYKTWEAYRDKCEKSQFYSAQRIDLLIISISSGAILITANSIDKILLLDKCGRVFFYLSIILYALSIVTNLLSQRSAEKAHEETARWARKEIRIINEQEDGENDCNDNKHNDMTIFFNNVSFWSLILGITISLISFASIVA